MKQLAMNLAAALGWGGARKGAGRPSSGRVSHAKREHAADNPVHVTVHAMDDVPNLRSKDLGPVVGRHFRSRLGRRKDFRIVVFSIQRTHLHLIVEADDQKALSRGVQGFLSSLAKKVNRHVGRHGRFWRDRYHGEEITSPTHMRNVLRYVLHNTAHHGGPLGIDPFSSATWFPGFRDHVAATASSPVADALTWLLRRGWHERTKAGLLGVHEPPAEHAHARKSRRPPPKRARVTRPLRGLAVTPET